MGSTSSKEKEVASDTQSCKNSSALVVTKAVDEVERCDFYEMFGLVRYCEMTEENIEKLKINRNKLLLRYHPDKNTEKLDKQQCESISQKILHGYEILSSPELKRRYDLQLRRLNGEERLFDSSDKWIKWTINVGLIGLAIPVLIAAATATAPAVLIVSGSALLGAGITGSFKTVADPDCSMIEYTKNVIVGAAAGAAGGGITATFAPSLAAATSVGKVLIASGIGAGSAVSGQAIKDGVDLAINAYGGDDAIRDVRPTEQIVSFENGKQYVLTAIVGGLVGGVTQGVANNFTKSAAAITEEVVETATATAGSGRDAGVRALNNARDTIGNIAKKSISEIFAQKVLENSAGQATHLGIRALLEMYKRIGDGKSLSEAITHASRDTLLCLPGAIITIAAGAALSTGIEYRARVQIEMKSQQLKSNQGVHFNADGSTGSSPKTVGDDTFGHTLTEHTGERHMGSGEMAMARAKISYKEPASLFSDQTTASDSISAAGQKLLSNIDKNAIARDFNNNLQRVPLSSDPAIDGTLLKGPAPPSTSITGNIYSSKGTVTVDVDMGRPVGMAVKYDPATNTYSYAECTKAKACFEVYINPTTQQTEMNLKTAFPIADAGAFTNTIPAENLFFGNQAANVSNTAQANCSIGMNVSNTASVIGSGLNDAKANPLLNESRKKEKKA